VATLLLLRPGPPHLRLPDHAGLQPVGTDPVRVALSRILPRLPLRRKDAALDPRQELARRPGTLASRSLAADADDGPLSLG